jgi:peptidoglycan/xylan/chitin deacetylase (PgdA/CDA1 family)
MLLVVTYHYLAEEAPAAPRAIFPATPALLERQVEELGRSYELVSRDDLLRALDGEAELPPRGALVTFDDGLRCQVELALPVLDRLGAPGLFFVPGLPLSEGRVLDVHKVHRLREAMADEEILAALGAEAPPVPPGRHVYDDPLAAGVKELLATRASDELDELLVHAGAEVHPDLYMTAEDVADLERRGMLGAHGYSHDARDDFARGADVLEALTGARPHTMSYPYGRPAPGAEGFAAAFTTERKVNKTLGEPLLLGRFDTNDLPGGRSPLRQISESDLLVGGDGST